MNNCTSRIPRKYFLVYTLYKYGIIMAGDELTWLDKFRMNMEGDYDIYQFNWMDYIGIYGPLISGAIGIFHLWGMTKYLIGFVFSRFTRKGLEGNIRRLKNDLVFIKPY